MTAILPPSERLWWKHPLDRVEGTWIAIAFAWCMVMFFMMIYWHAYGNQNLSTETYKTTPVKFAAKAQVVVDQYTVRTETDQTSAKQSVTAMRMRTAKRAHQLSKRSARKWRRRRPASLIIPHPS